MASTPITEYERKRLENIKRNEQMMASLKLQSKALELSTAAKRNRVETKSYKTSPKKPKSNTPIVIRRSLRTRGIAPDGSTAKGIDDDLIPSSPVKTPIRKLEVISMEEAYLSRSSDRLLIDTVKDMSDNVPLGRRLIGKGSDFDLGKMELKRENIARVMPNRILNLKFLPCSDRSLIVAGNRFGNIVFWDVDCQEEGNDGIYLYQPHTANVSGISIKPFSLSKVYSSSYDGLLRQLDFEKESFDLVYSTDDAIFSLSQRPQDAESIYFSEGSGLLNVWDTRAGKSSSSWMLHEKRINTIDFNPENTNLMVTSSTDGSACIWDLRLVDTHKPNNLKIIKHNKAVHSAYFSPSGKCLVTTSVDDLVGILSGADLADTSMIYHNNRTGRWISSFRAIWGWDDTHIFIGSMSREVDVISTTGNMSSLRSSDVSAIPCRFAAHPLKVGTLAAATSGGQIYLWTQS